MSKEVRQKEFWILTVWLTFNTFRRLLPQVYTLSFLWLRGRAKSDKNYWWLLFYIDLHVQRRLPLLLGLGMPLSTTFCVLLLWEAYIIKACWISSTCHTYKKCTMNFFTSQQPAIRQTHTDTHTLCAQARVSARCWHQNTTSWNILWFMKPMAKVGNY